MEDRGFFQNNKKEDGFPEGFKRDDSFVFEQNVPPEITPITESFLSKINNKVIILGSIAAGLIVISIILTAVFIGAFKEKGGESDIEVAKAYVDCLKSRDEQGFNRYIKPKTDKKVVKDFVKSSISIFSDYEIENVDYEQVSEDVVNMNIYYKTSEGTEVIIPVEFGTSQYKDLWYFESCNFGNNRIVKSDDVATPDDAEEEEVTEEAIEENVPSEILTKFGNDECGYITVPDDYSDSDAELPSFENAKTQMVLSRTYNDVDEYISLIEFSSNTGNLRETSEKVSLTLFGDKKSLREDFNGSPVYSRFEENNGIRTMVRSFRGSDDIIRTLLIMVPVEDTLSQNVIDSYELTQGLYTASKNSSTDAESVFQKIGSDFLGYINIPGEYQLDENYNQDGIDSVGYSNNDSAVILLSYSGTDKADMDTKECAENVRKDLLGDGSEELQTGDWFPGAYYSVNIDSEGWSREMYLFKGTDGINRVLVFIHPQDDKSLSDCYSSYQLPCGVVPDTY